MAAGLPRLFGRVYRPGHVAEIGETSGVVRAVGLLDVEVEDSSGRRVLVPHLATLFLPTRLPGLAAAARFELSVDPAEDQALVREILLRTGGPGTAADLVRLDASGALYRVAGPGRRPGRPGRLRAARRGSEAGSPRSGSGGGGVSTLQSLFVLLLVAYMGGFLMGGRGLRGRGLPSGSEWLVAGLVAGPSALGLVGGAEVAYFAPLALLATGWIALLVGLTFGVDGERRIGAGGIALGVLGGAPLLRRGRRRGLARARPGPLGGRPLPGPASSAG